MKWFEYTDTVKNIQLKPCVNWEAVEIDCEEWEERMMILMRKRGY